VFSVRQALEFYSTAFWEKSKGTAMPWFDPRPVHVRSEVDNRALEQVFLSVVRFSLSVSFHQCPILFLKPLL
jgi:hypothetical protein